MDLHAFARHGLRSRTEEAERTWRGVLDALRTRLRHIDEANGELHDSDPDHARQKIELDAERRGVGRAISDHGNAGTQAALVGLGLLPNYALIDNVTTLQATLWWTEVVGPNGREQTRSQLRSYDRPARYALTELAPGNTFSVNGYKHQVTGLEIGTADRPAWQVWRFCPDCGYVRTRDAREDRSACPRCGGAGIADDGSCLHQCWSRPSSPPAPAVRTHASAMTTTTVSSATSRRSTPSTSPPSASSRDRGGTRRSPLASTSAAPR